MWFANFLQRFDWLLLSATTLILSMGMLALYSFSETAAGNVYFGKQLLFVCLGVGAMFFIGALDYRHIARFSTLLYFVTLGQPFRALAHR